MTTELRKLVERYTLSVYGEMIPDASRGRLSAALTLARLTADREQVPVEVFDRMSRTHRTRIVNPE